MRFLDAEPSRLYFAASIGFKDRSSATELIVPFDSMNATERQQKKAAGVGSDDLFELKYT